MSPKKVAASSDIYTALIGVVCAIAAASAGFVAYKCHSDYETLFKIVEVFGYGR